jgi:hypothetical protein
MIPVVLYASKSSPDEKGITTDQLEQIRVGLPFLPPRTRLRQEGGSALADQGLHRSAGRGRAAALRDGRRVPDQPSLVGIASLQGWKESADKAAHARRGARQRKEAGKPIGATLQGYRLERAVVAGTVITSRVEDEQFSPIMERAFTLFDQGHTPGEIARLLNPQRDP